MFNTEGRYSNPVSKLNLWLKNWKGRKLTSKRPNKLTSEQAEGIV